MAEEGDFKVSADKYVNKNKCPVIYTFLLLKKCVNIINLIYRVMWVLFIYLYIFEEYKYYILLILLCSNSLLYIDIIGYNFIYYFYYYNI